MPNSVCELDWPSRGRTEFNGADGGGEVFSRNCRRLSVRISLHQNPMNHFGSVADEKGPENEQKHGAALNYPAIKGGVERSSAARYQKTDQAKPEKVGGNMTDVKRGDTCETGLTRE